MPFSEYRGARRLSDRLRRSGPVRAGPRGSAPGPTDPMDPAMTALLESSEDGIVVLEAVRQYGTIIDFELVMVSATAERLVNGVAADLLGKRLSTIVADIPPARFAQYVAAVETGTSRTTRMQFPGSTERWFDVSAMGFSRTGLVTIFRDVTDVLRHEAIVDGLRQRQEALERQSLTDPLTGLGNRLLVLSRLDHAMRRLDRNETVVAVVFIDLDGLKPVNDTYGHAVGDAVLIEIGHRLRTVTRPYDTVGRIGGDEFVVLCEDLDDDDVDQIVRRLLARCAEPIHVDGREVRVTASMGVALADSSNSEPGMLIIQADTAMYRAKSRGGARIEYFDAATQDRASRRHDLEAEFRTALATGELDIDFDCLITPDRTTIGFRATVGWTHPRHGFVDEPTLLDVAKTVGSVEALTDWVLDRAIGIAGPRMSSLSDRTVPFVIVDVDSGVLTGPGFAERLIGAVRRNGADPRSICVAVDGAYMVDHTDDVKAVLDQVATFGARVARQGVMTSTSSHTYLRDLPISIVILDDALTNDLCDTDRELLGVVIRTAKGGGRLVVAPARDASQFDVLVSLGADFVQSRMAESPSTVR